MLMANGMPSGVYERVFFALDFDNASRSAVRAARELGLIEGTAVTAMHAFHPPALGMMKRSMAGQDPIDHYVAGEEQQARVQFEEFLGEVDLRPHRRLLQTIQGSPAHNILSCAEAEDAELIIVGTNRRKGVERLVQRSVSSDILRDASRDVLVVPTADIPGLSRE